MAKIYLSPAAHAHDNPCSYDRKNCGENVHCNRYMDELEPYLRACGFEVKRADKGNTGDGIRVSVREANDWGANLYYVAHTNAGGGCRNGIMIYSEASRAWAEALRKRRLEVYPRRSNISVNPNLYEINQTKAPCLYEELVFHDNLEDITWFHGHMREMAEATAKAFCDIFGVSFVDPYKKGEVTIMGKVVNRDELVAWIDAHAVEVEEQPEPEVKPEPVAIKAGDKVVFKSGVTQWGTGSGNKGIPSWAQDGKTTFTVLEIVKEGTEARIGNASGAYTGTAYLKDLEKVG